MSEVSEGRVQGRPTSVRRKEGGIGWKGMGFKWMGLDGYLTN